MSSLMSWQNETRNDMHVYGHARAFCEAIETQSTINPADLSAKASTEASAQTSEQPVVCDPKQIYQAALKLLQIDSNARGGPWRWQMAHSRLLEQMGGLPDCPGKELAMIALDLSGEEFGPHSKSTWCPFVFIVLRYAGSCEEGPESRLVHLMSTYWLT